MGPRQPLSPPALKRDINGLHGFQIPVTLRSLHEVLVYRVPVLGHDLGCESAIPMLDEASKVHGRVGYLDTLEIEDPCNLAVR